MLVSAFAGKAAMENGAEKYLAAPFSAESVSMNWTGGFGAEGLRIDQPEGFGPGAAVEVDKALLDVGLRKLISGVYKVGVQVKGFRATVVRDEKGRLNLAHLLKPAPKGEAPPPKPAKKAGTSEVEESPLSSLQAWFRLENASIEVKDLAGGISGKVLLDATVSNDRPGAPLKVVGKARLFTADGNPGGVVDIDGSLDPVKRNGDLRIRGSRMALETWRALLPARENLAGLKGNLGMDVHVRLLEDRLETTGRIELRDLAARLTALGGAPVRQASWVLEPNVTFDLKKGQVDFSKVRADAGPLQIHGLDPAKAAEILKGEKAVGALLTLDLARLPRIPGILPPEALMAGKISLSAALPEGSPSKIAFNLKGDGITYRDKEIKAGPFSLEGEGGADPAKGISGLHTVLTLKGIGAVLGENVIKDVLARLSLKEGGLDARLEKAVVNGGPAQGEVSIKLGGKSIPMKASLHLDGASVNASIAPVLAYFIPFAVTPKDALLSGKAGIDTKIAGEIPLSGGLSIRRILESAKGEGKLALQGLSFQGSPALKQVLSAFRHQGGYFFKGLSTNFRLDGGRIIQKEIDIPHGGSKIRISGFTDLAGNLDYTFDFSDLLKKNKKGKRLLALLGGNAVPLKLKGTIFSPKPEIKPLDLKSLLGAGQEALREKAGKALEKGIQKGLQNLFKKKKKRKK